MPTYSATGIIYARATENNLAVAATPSGGADYEITERIEPPTLASGKISSTTIDSVVYGIDTNFSTDFEVGDYLFAYGTGANPVLVGKIDSIDSNTQITLTTTASSNADEAPCGKMRKLIKNNESILIRVPRIPLSSTQSYIPNWASMRQSPFTNQSFNNSGTGSYTNINQYSDTGIPTSIGSAVNVPYLITPLNNFTVFVNNNVTQCWRSAAEFPNFIFALYNPYGQNSQQNLNPSTMYKIFTSEVLDGLLISENYNTLNLYNAGYNVPRNANLVASNANNAGNTQGSN